MNLTISPKKQQGISLIEVMVSILISLILLAGVIQIFVGNKQTYTKQEALSRVQENGRFAMDYLAREIRMADFWGCMGRATDVSDNLNPPGAGDANPVDPTLGGIGGTNNDGLNGSDTLMLQGAFGDPIPIVSNNQNAASFVTVVNSGLDDFDIVIATDCAKADIFEITNTNANAATIVANTGAVASGPGNAVTPALAYDGTGTLYRIQMKTYSIQAGASGEPALFSNDGGLAVELVEGVQDMQILYGEDINNDQTADRYVDASDGALDMANVVSIRITLTLQTLEDLHTSARDAANNAIFGRIQRTYTSTTSIRNRLIFRI